MRAYYPCVSGEHATPHWSSNALPESKTIPFPATTLDSLAFAVSKTLDSLAISVAEYSSWCVHLRCLPFLLFLRSQPLPILNLAYVDPFVVAFSHPIPCLEARLNRHVRPQRRRAKAPLVSLSRRRPLKRQRRARREVGCNFTLMRTCLLMHHAEVSAKKRRELEAEETRRLAELEDDEDEEEEERYEERLFDEEEQQEQDDDPDADASDERNSTSGGRAWGSYEGIGVNPHATSPPPSSEGELPGDNHAYITKDVVSPCTAGNSPFVDTFLEHHE